MLPPGFSLSAMQMEDYAEVMALWSTCEGVRVNESPEELKRILTRNPELSAVIRTEEQLAAAVLCCHDGRRGYLYHLGVAAKFRKLGLARELVEHCLAKLKGQGIGRCSIFVIAGNESGETFWRRTGWRERVDLKMFARDL
jgi:ribosomal protein S18 acetylase RimI-like enzyme